MSDLDKNTFGAGNGTCGHRRVEHLASGTITHWLNLLSTNILINEDKMKSLFILIFITCLYSLVGAQGVSPDSAEANYKELNWKEPPPELLSQKYCPNDSSADAMIVQKEMVFVYNYPYLDVVSHRRYKIYTERGLSYAQFSENEDPWTKILNIEAKCYDTTGKKTELSPKDIHEELLWKNQKTGIKFVSKTFAVPNASVGCVIDVYFKISNLGLITPPVFRYQEDIPIGIARFRMEAPSYLQYSYVFTNAPLINPLAYSHEHEFICEARDIPAVEDEKYRLPERNLVTDLWVYLKCFKDGLDIIWIADTWNTLLKDYTKDFENSYESSKIAKKLADSLLAITTDHKQLISLAYDTVKKRYGDMTLFRVSGPSDNINNMMKEKELDAEDKATVLWAVLKYLGIESEVVWVNSDNCRYTAISSVPSLRMFDSALLYIPGDTLYLDLGDPGARVGLIDEAYSERMMCRPMAKMDFISKTPKIDKLGSTVVDIKYSLSDDGIFEGQGIISLSNQSALEAKRVFGIKGFEDEKSFLNKMLFKTGCGEIDSFAVVDDSLQAPTQFAVNVWMKEKKSFEPDDPDFEMAIYPGPLFNITTIDDHPPRKYPIYFNAKRMTTYMVEWNFGNLYKPLNLEGLNLSTGNRIHDYKLLSEYDPSLNRLSVRRQYSRSTRIFDPDYAPDFEKFMQNIQKYDLSSIMVVKK
jgi:hypothetical protein